MSRHKKAKKLISVSVNVDKEVDKFPFMGERGGRERRNDHILKKYEGQHISKMSLIYTFCDFCRSSFKYFPPKTPEAFPPVKIHEFFHPLLTITLQGRICSF